MTFSHGLSLTQVRTFAWTSEYKMAGGPGFKISPVVVVIAASAAVAVVVVVVVIMAFPLPLNLPRDTFIVLMVTH